MEFADWVFARHKDVGFQSLICAPIAGRGGQVWGVVSFVSLNPLKLRRFHFDVVNAASKLLSKVIQGG